MINLRDIHLRDIGSKETDILIINVAKAIDWPAEDVITVPLDTLLAMLVSRINDHGNN